MYIYMQVPAETTDYNTKLTLNDVKRKQSGIYVITAENIHGRDEAEVEVVVLGKSPKPGEKRLLQPLI